MILSLRSISSSSRRRVSNEEGNPKEHKLGYNYWKESSKSKDDHDHDVINCTSFTVWRKSLLVSCNGFTVIDSKGNLVYRVDNYRGHPGEIVLMDASGKSILTMRRQKTMKLVDNWLVYDGEGSDEEKGKRSSKKQPICNVKKNINMSLLQSNSKELAHVYVGKSGNSNNSTKRPTFVIEGSYNQRCCKVLDKSTKKIVAEIKRKEAINGCASFGLEVFQLIVWPGFDTGFAMTLVLLLDQMFS